MTRSSATTPVSLRVFLAKTFLTAEVQKKSATENTSKSEQLNVILVRLKKSFIIERELEEFHARSHVLVAVPLKCPFINAVLLLDKYEYVLAA